MTEDVDWRAVCTCSQHARRGVLVDWVRGTVTHPYADCPRHQCTDRWRARRAHSDGAGGVASRGSDRASDSET